MKKFGFFLFAVLGLIACGDDNNDPTPEQHVTCSNLHLLKELW